MKEKKITIGELKKLFGDSIPMNAWLLLTDLQPLPLPELRNRLRQIANDRHGSRRPDAVRAAFDIYYQKETSGPHLTAIMGYIVQLEKELDEVTPEGK